MKNLLRATFLVLVLASGVGTGSLFNANTAKADDCSDNYCDGYYCRANYNETQCQNEVGTEYPPCEDDTPCNDPGEEG